MSSSKPRIAVVGSINADLVVRCQQLPRPGETQLATSAKELCGGKGANQAVAAARAGGQVALVGRVGDDAFAQRLRTSLSNEHINIETMGSIPGTSSGLAIVAVEDSGQNSIMVLPGANGHLSPADVKAAANVIAEADVLLVQLETPLESVLAALAIAREHGVRTILDPAPAPPQWPAALLDVDLCCPNQTEAAACVGHPVETIAQAQSAARVMHAKGAKNVAITLGDRGTLLLTDDMLCVVDPYPTNVVDTTAAGDAFAGALAVHWAQSEDLRAATQFGNAAAAIAVSREGAQASMASRPEIDALWGSVR